MDHNVTSAIDEVHSVQALIDEIGITDALQQRDFEAQLALSKVLLQQEIFWREKARVNNFSFGDRNTAYFHRLAKIRSTSKPIALLHHEHGVITDATELELHIVNYFKGIFCGSNNCSANSLIQDCIPDLVSTEDNNFLTSTPSDAEIKLAIFSMNGDGAPGPDGFGGHFYQHFWDIVASDVIYAVQSFFLTGKLPPRLNSNILILIPKFPEADRIENFRPIALANFQFKIITKILADRLSSVASRIISPQQRGFIPDRHIADCVIIASEAVNVLSKKSYAGNIALKIDISKAFDTLDWNFLLAVLKQFGFGETFCTWIKAILHSAKLSVLVNGKLAGFFPCTRGVRQGDPLSPLLFCIAGDVLSRSILKASTEGKLTPMSLCRNVQVPTHVLYADDIMIFCKGSKSNIRNLMHIFHLYGEVSGQVINKQKSKFYSGAISNSRLLSITNLLGFGSGSIPFNYLGCPIFVGKPKTIHFKAITDKIKMKMASWKGVLLSIMGRVQLVRSIIHGM
jgi:hypothetical protein